MGGHDVSGSKITWGVSMMDVGGSDLFHSARVDRDMEAISLPNDLNGKRVMELFSGGAGNSVGKLVKARGGEFLSVDASFMDDVGIAYQTEALALLGRTPSDSCDFVFMFGPPWWNGETEVGHNFSNFNEVMETVKESMRVVKKASGSFVAVGNGISRKDYAAISEELRKGHDFGGWFTQLIIIPEQGTDRFGEPMGIIKIARR